MQLGSKEKVIPDAARIQRRTWVLIMTEDSGVSQADLLIGALMAPGAIEFTRIPVKTFKGLASHMAGNDLCHNSHLNHNASQPPAGDGMTLLASNEKTIKRHAHFLFFRHFGNTHFL